MGPDPRSAGLDPTRPMAAWQDRPGAPQVARGASLGRFLVVDRVGAGGMGVVFSAYDPSLERRVALKLLRGSVAHSRVGRERLIREAQAMARVSHPNIVAVHEVGVVGDAAFVVMDFVEGQSLRAWLAAEHRDWRVVVATFVAAGRGLAAAHRAGIVHRDFKPDNVLIDGDGRVRVTDFGLAASVETTATGGGTPAYMAPEQARGQPVDGRADQFSFAVALFEALFGAHPFPGTSHDAIQARIIGGGVRAVPRGDVPARLRDAVVRALAPAPDGRWPTMNALLAALEQRPRRRWIAVAATVLAAAAAVAVARPRTELCSGGRDAMAATWNPAVRAQLGAGMRRSQAPFADDAFARVARSLDDASERWIGAHRAACLDTRVRHARSEAALDQRMACLARVQRRIRALVELLSARPDSETLAQATSASTALAAVDECDDPAAIAMPRGLLQRLRVERIRAQLDGLQAIAETARWKLGIERARAVVADARAAGHASTLAEALVIASRYEYSLGGANDAVPLLYDAVSAAATARDDVTATRALGWLVYRVGRLDGHFDEAAALMPLAEASLARAGNPPLLRASLWEQESWVLTGEHALEAGLDRARESTALFERVRGPLHPDVAVGLTALANAEDKLDHHDAALRAQERALAILITAYGTDSARVARALSNLGTFTSEQGHYDAADAYYRRALAIQERIYGPVHPQVANILGNLGTNAVALGRDDEAYGLYERALAIRERVLGPDHAVVGPNLVQLCELDLHADRLERAAARCERSLALRTRLFGPDSMELGGSLMFLARVRAAQHRFAEAHALSERGLAITRRTFGDQHSRMIWPLDADAAVYRAEGRPRAALAPIRRAIEIMDAQRGPHHPYLVGMLTLEAAAALDLDDARAARPALERAARLVAENHVAGADRFARDFQAARLRWADGDRDGALTLAAAARDGLGSRPRERAEVSAWIARYRRLTGSPALATRR